MAVFRQVAGQPSKDYHKRLLRVLNGTTVALLLTGMSERAHGQAADSADRALQQQDIVVTAQKRTERLQDVPLALTVVTSATLADRGITRFDELGRLVPSLSFDPGATPNENSFSLRGISAAAVGQGQQSSVGVYVDGVYLTGRSALNLDLFDVERIEVLRGPQGTLFGRNTVAGALSIVSRRPAESVTGAVEIEYGSYDLQRIRGSVGGRVGDGPFYVQTAVSHVARDGYVKNLADGSRLQGGSSIANRTYLGYRPEDGALTVEIVGDYTHEENQSGLLSDRPFDRRVSIDAPNRDERTVYGLSATATFDLG
ncbi:TonB-dependent receptor [Sphingobium algorifonticola]|uniref:TonB-dependent receptor plug domain-containing protein n=1 Tax=Sphingobium algorifonticola TaxID=2008318 RepID=A0A437JA25_9SPHN|nr:TonB-dependent receptor plug domain-containing protein [Sphingobium algorifonticola]RVT42357.1 hypothetical protein ENE74_09190 [Sphingobium algorifonticola]